MGFARRDPSGDRPNDDARLRSIAVSVLERLLPPGSGLVVRLWDGTRLNDDGDPTRPTLVLREPAALAAMLKPPFDLSAGEAFLRGEIDVEGGLEAAFAAIDDLDPHLSLLDWPRLALEVSAIQRRAAPRSPLMARLRGRAHTRSRDRDAIAHHYDVSNAFYRLWLDERMVYSCAYFPDGDETLDAAQEAKLDLICRKLALAPGDRLLDIGCGWGALVIFAAQRYGVSAWGVTLSEAQCQEARERVAAAGVAERVRIELLDYRDVRGEFDKVASVGMSEHVGRERLGDYFRGAWERLAPRGLMLEHAITRGPFGDARTDTVISGEFSRRYVFPDGEILPLAEKLQAAEALGFEIRDVEDLREHYAITLRHWVRNLEAHVELAEREVGPERTRLWRLFMSAAAHQFVVGQIAIHQALLAKPDARGRVDLPRTRASWYRA
jgi:cyclopropane-fatty-acyl-phospholipid synthase